MTLVGCLMISLAILSLSTSVANAASALRYIGDALWQKRDRR